jgi:hypothetical protein
VVWAHLQTQATTGDADERLARKLRLILGMQGLGYSEDMILELFRFIDLMMKLPPALSRVFDAEIRRYGAENAMPYLTTIERFAQYRSILEVLSVRFGEVPPELEESLEQIEDADQLKQLLRQAILVATIADFQALLPGN